MPKLKIDKHIVYTLIMNNLDWFKPRKAQEEKEYIFLSRYSIENCINKYLKKDYDVDIMDPHYDPPYVALSASTLTVMVNDGVMERKYSDFQKCYTYRPYSELLRGYCAKHIFFPQTFS